MDKYVFFTFKGQSMCFIHVLLNAIDMKEKGMDVKIVMEGESVKLIKELNDSNNQLFTKAVEMGLIDCVCKACSAKMDVLEYNDFSNILVSGDMNGHPSMESYLKKGYKIITI